VDDHPVVLQERVQPLAVRPRPGDARRERVGREGHEHAEEEDDRHQRRDDVRLKLEVALAEPLHARADVGAEEKEPPEQRPVLPAPEGGEQVLERHRAVRVVRDVADAEVVRDEGVGEAEHRDADEGDRAVGAEAGGLERPRAPFAPAARETANV
jgi:hypothetical protein